MPEKKEIQVKRNIELYVLSVKDIERLEGCTYQEALRKFKTYEYFYINSKPYILAKDYFVSSFKISEILMYEPITEGIETKLIKVMPMMFTVSDIQSIFDCGHRQAYQIMDVIPGVFKINNKRYVSDENFKKWLKGLPNTVINIG